MGDTSCSPDYDRSHLAAGSFDLVRTHLARVASTTAAARLQRRRSTLRHVCVRPYAHLRCRQQLHLILRAMHRYVR
nr:unnamed protein product [Callosobruchus analis]